MEAPGFGRGLVASGSLIRRGPASGQCPAASFGGVARQLLDGPQKPTGQRDQPVSEIGHRRALESIMRSATSATSSRFDPSSTVARAVMTPIAIDRFAAEWASSADAIRPGRTSRRGRRRASPRGPCTARAFVVLGVGDRELEEAGEDQVAFVVGEVHAQIDDDIDGASLTRARSSASSQCRSRSELCQPQPQCHLTPARSARLSKTAVSSSVATAYSRSSSS